jgi:flagellar biosynthesis component FlhA
MHEYKTEYELVRWPNPAALIKALNELVNAGWREHMTKVTADSDAGWTIMSKTTKVLPDLMEAKLPLRQLWDILNRMETYYAIRPHVDRVVLSEVTHEISKQVKAHYEKFAQEMQ